MKQNDCEYQYLDQQLYADAWEAAHERFGNVVLGFAVFRYERRLRRELTDDEVQRVLDVDLEGMPKSATPFMERMAHMVKVDDGYIPF